MKKIVLSTLIVIISLKISAQAEVKPELLYSNKLSIVAGLIQPIALNGWNVELNYTTKRMIFDYSHGFNLHPPSGGEYKIQNVVLYLPYSTGFGLYIRPLMVGAD